ncbi:transmembrane protein 14c [Basidiobolus meristosporus CBS 931.73]|uniref:Transmembrane protein 14c n=1 Tax=Basidiobolus meristosporus CBS 931.73 TaxID=1314790 RepID=A0A1Y1YWM0_9FUNG|nr:transmembrane protein 14c [Basidiobolus meristosporus CBS 931.73]|eukprot:ORY02432.1 transmembrane protein 14c [Basidiobolus meristosporus CBS 931.73]
MAQDFAGYAYAMVVIVGGLIGFIKAGSVASLISGVTFGGVMAYAATRVSQNPQDVYLALVTSGALLALMGFRFSKSQKFMPAGLVTVLSLIMSIRYGAALL